MPPIENSGHTEPVGKLIDHRRRLAANPLAYVQDIEGDRVGRLIRTLVPHLRKAGHSVSVEQNRVALERVVRLIFTAQEHRPMFHVEGTELPLCWNSPRNWNIDYIKYEWGHMRSRNQNPGDAYRLENLGLYSARCNQHIQTSLNIEELMTYGGIIATRIASVLTKRRYLHESEEWRNLKQSLPKTGA